MKRILSVLAFLPFSLPAQDHLLLQKPALSQTQIVFSYADDLWSVPRQGGQAVRLTTGTGQHTDPVFSPDGKWIAFSGEYDGNIDVFVMPAEGGQPRRLTWHPGADHAIAWTPDGTRILFKSSRNTPNDGDRFYTVPIEGGFPTEVPLPIAEEGSYSPDASHLAYVPLFQWEQAWKHYRGGQTRKIWLADLSNSSVVPVPRENSNDFNPMWIGNTVYFLSDRNGPVTLFSYDTQTKQVRQVVENHGLDLKCASAGPGAIVYEQFGVIHLYDLKTGQTKAVDIRLDADIPALRPHFVSVTKRLTNADISPTGARAVFEAHGDIITVPASKGDPRNITNTPGVMERFPAWSPDGSTIAFFSDESGEYMLHLVDQNGLGDVKKISLGTKPAYYLNPRWSPDSKKIAWLDCHAALWYMDLDQKKPILVDKDYYETGDSMTPAWSPDSKWLAYSKSLRNFLGAVYLYSLQNAASKQVTDGMSDAQNPVWDKNGKFLYFRASTDVGPAMEPDIESRSRPVSYSVYLMVLSKDEPSPLAPESDDEKAAEQKKADQAKKEDKPAPPVVVKIDFDNIGQRVLALPIPAKRYSDLKVGKTGVVFAVESAPPSPDGPPVLTVNRFDLSKRKSDVVAAGVKTFRISFDGEKILYQQDDKWMLTSLKPMPDSAGAPSAPPMPSPDGEGALKTDDIQVRVDPPAEWKQMYRDVWRIERDFFYDPHYHGLNLTAAEQFYQPWVDHIASRRDLNYLFEEMLGQIGVGHMFIWGPDDPDAKHVTTGLLGADYAIENGRYRFTRVYNGENWNPKLKAPLTQPGVNVVSGEYLIAVNGRDVRPPANLYSFFEGTAGKSTVLKVGPDSSGAKAREVIVVPVDDEHHLRHLAWIEDNRRKVDQMTGGRVAYVHMPDTGFGGFESFYRYFYAQVGKQAAIIDERFNHGGALATDIIEHLARQPLSGATLRDGAEMFQPQGAIFGPKVMIINEFAGSGGDAMPWYFHREGVGKLIGERTWGGLVGLGDYPPLMDGGGVTAPSFAIWNINGTYDIENHGISPDIAVDLDPAAVRSGHDPQLEKAVEVVLDELRQNPPREYQQPPFPNHHDQPGDPLAARMQGE